MARTVAKCPDHMITKHALICVKCYDKMNENHEYAQAELREAVRLLNSAKRAFAPETTNSETDMFLEKYREGKWPIR